MKRIIFDVPRWNIFLHRQARGMPPVNVGDAPDVQVQDELFEQLYSGAPTALAPEEQHSDAGPWARRIHDQCVEMPAFTRLASECRGDSDAAAVGMDELMTELAPHLQEGTPAEEAALRRGLRSACAKAADAVGDFREAGQGLQHVALGAAQDGTASRTLARRLREDGRLRRIALLAGRFKRIAATKRRQRVRHGVEEIVDIEQGGELGRMLPVELAKLRHSRLRLVALRDLVEQQAMQYRLEGHEARGKGPLVLALDKSGSMAGAPDVWATAVALALLDQAQRERRPFALLGFDGGIKFEAVVQPGDLMPEAGLFVPCDGGTNIGGVLTRGLDLVKQHRGRLRQADLVVITDGVSDTIEAAAIRRRATSMGVTVFGIGIGVDAASLAPWCDDVQVDVDLLGLDDGLADQLFGR